MSAKSEIRNPKSEILLQVTDLGRMAYLPALEIQRTTHQQVLDRLAPPTLLLLEHDPVITISQRREAGQHLTADAATLARLGIDVQPTDRGGDITYHGPGQLVVYPILRLDEFGLNLTRYMRLLEQVVIDTVADFGVEAHRETGATGVWTDAKPQAEGPAAKLDLRGAKIAALGVRIRRGITMHGLALNVTTDLDHFKTIIPCGLAGRRVTSLREVLGDATPAMARVKAALVENMRRRLTGT